MKFKLTRLLWPRRASIKRVHGRVRLPPAQLSPEDLEALEEEAAALEAIMEDEVLAETMEVAAPPASQHLHYARLRPAAAMSPKELLEDTEGAVAAISEAFAISAERARALLDQSEANWDPLRLLDAVGAHDDFVDRLHSDAAPAATFSLNEVADGIYECPVCADYVARGELLSCRGGHYSCIGCWTQHIETILRDGKYRAHCMFPGCTSTPLDHCEQHQDAAIEARLSHVAQNLRHHFRSRAIARARGATMCPNDHCDRFLFLARHAHEDELPWLRPVMCACGQDVCVSCGGEGHAPMSCKMLELWRLRTARASDDQIVRSTRRCPNAKCAVPIEKNGGCPHMFCVSCNVHFCWTCMWHSEPNGSYSHACRGVMAATVQHPMPELDPNSFAILSSAMNKSQLAGARRHRVTELSERTKALNESYRVETGSEWDTEDHYKNAIATIQRAFKLVAHGFLAASMCENSRCATMILFATTSVNQAADDAEAYFRSECAVPVTLSAFHGLKAIVAQLEHHMEALCRTVAAIASGEYKLYGTLKKGKLAAHDEDLKEPFPLDDLTKLAETPLQYESIVDVDDASRAGGAAAAAALPTRQPRDDADDDTASITSASDASSSASEWDDSAEWAEEAYVPPPPPPPAPSQRRTAAMPSPLPLHIKLKLGEARRQLAAANPLIEAMLRERAQVAAA